jgi:hypothetical protein
LATLRSGSPIIGKFTFAPWVSSMSFAQRSWSSVASIDRPTTFTPRLSNSGFRRATVPSSVVHTGVKSFGCENSTAHESPIQSWNEIFPSVVSASKSGAVSPIVRVIPVLLHVECYPRVGRSRPAVSSPDAADRSILP